MLRKDENLNKMAAKELADYRQAQAESLSLAHEDMAEENKKAAIILSGLQKKYGFSEAGATPTTIFTTSSKSSKGRKMKQFSINTKVEVLHSAGDNAPAWTPGTVVNLVEVQPGFKAHGHQPGNIVKLDGDKYVTVTEPGFIVAAA